MNIARITSIYILYNTMQDLAESMAISAKICLMMPTPGFGDKVPYISYGLEGEHGHILFREHPHLTLAKRVITSKHYPKIEQWGSL